MKEVRVATSEFAPVPHVHDEFLERAGRRKGFAEAYAANEDEHRLVRELLAARLRAGLTQEQVAESMGTTKSAISRLEGGAKHSPSVSTLRKYARAVGCDVQIRLVPMTRDAPLVVTAHRVARNDQRVVNTG
jgi:DNA-binding XRE family transcriptional regulator